MQDESIKKEVDPKATTNDGVKVFCCHDELVPISNLNPNPQNPNLHPQEQISLLADIIEKQGWRQPITVSNQSNLIVKGHGRLSAAKLKGWSNVPVDYQDYPSKDAELADLMADNKLAELSNIDEVLEREILSEIEDEDILSLTGYSEAELENILDELIDEEEEEPEEEKKEPGLFVMAGDTWYLGEHRLIVAEADPVMDAIVSTYVYETGNMGCTCIRDEKEYSYMELITTWAKENDVEDEVFKMRKPVVLKRK